MSNTITCAGNCFTKPLMCWSLLDWIIVIVIMFVVVLIFISVAEKKREYK